MGLIVLAKARSRRCVVKRTMKLIAIERMMRLTLALTAPALSEAEFARAAGLARRGARRAMLQVAAGRSMRQEAPRPERSNVRRFFAWAQRASPDERAKAASTLASAYLRDQTPPHARRGGETGRLADLGALRQDAELCLAMMVEDASAQVRRSLAWALACADDAPRHIVSALANDEPEIAAIVLAQSPVLSDAELAEWATIGCEKVQVALARRPSLNADVAASLAEIDRREVVMALIGNPAAHLTPGAMARIAKHFGEDGGVREALLARSGMPATLRYELVAAATRALPSAPFRLGEKHIERTMRDAMERCAIRGAHARPPDEVRDLMRHLRATGVLTAALLIRALVCGDRDFFNAAAAELTGLPPNRIAGFVREPFGPGFAALCRRMALPRYFLPPFRAALAALEELGGEHGDRILRPVVSRMIVCCESDGSPELSRLLSLLRRLEAESALGEARAISQSAAPRQGVSRPEMQSTLAPPVVVIERGLARMLSLLHRLEEEAAATLAEFEVAAPASEAERQISDGSLFAWFESFEAIESRAGKRRPSARSGRFDSRAA
jgi:uncharacterized protein (DUF2336 family)